MRKRYLIEPDGWPCSVEACPPGPFVCKDSLCFKSAYRPDGKVEAFNESGEVFVIYPATLVVQPVKVVTVFGEEDRRGTGRLAGADEDARGQG